MFAKENPSVSKTIPLFEYGEFENVRLKPDQLAKLNGRWGEPLAKQRIAHFSRQKEAHGYKYRSDYAALLAWYPDEERCEALEDDKEVFVHEHAVDLRRNMQRVQQDWDRIFMQHQHGDRCQHGAVCAYLWSK